MTAPLARPALPDIAVPWRLSLALVALLTLAGLAMRLYAVDVVGLWWDEFVTLGRAAWPVADLLRSLASEGPSDVSLDSSPPLFHLLVHLSLALGGNSDVAVKAPSILAGTLTIPVVWLLGRRLFGPRCALTAAAICAFSLFPVHYSREARPYALYLLCALTALYFLLQAMDRDRLRDWAGFVVANTLMFYASYLAAATFLAQGAMVVGLAVLLTRQGRRPEAVRLLARAGIAALVVVLAYVPWIPAHLFQMRTIAGSAPVEARFDSVSFSSVLRSFAAWQYQGPIPWPAILAAVAGLGVVRFLAVGRGRALAGLAVWSLTALAMAASLPTDIHVSVRYLVNIFFLFCFLLAGGADALLALAGRFGRGSLGAVLAVALGVAACLPAFAALSVYAKRDSPSVKAVLADLAAARANVDAIRYYRPRHLKIVADWYLAGSFETAADPFSRAYHRAFFLSPADDPDHATPAYARPVRQTFWADIAKIGLPNRAPLPLLAPYRQEFDDLSTLADAALLDNMAPDIGNSTLALYDCRRPGRAVFTFAVPPGVVAGPTPVRLSFAMRRGHAARPQGRITLRAGATPETAQPLLTVTAADFQPGAGEYAAAATLPPPDPATGQVSLVIDAVAGFVDGFVELSSLETQPPASIDPADLPPAWEQSAAALAANTEVSPGLPDGRLMGGNTLYGFADQANARLHLGGPEALAAYLAAYPDDTPVYTLSDDDGRVRARYFDPLLDRPYTAIGKEQTPLVSGFAGQTQARGLWATGTIAGQTVTLGQTQLTLPLTAPAGATLSLGDDGRGRLLFQTDFDRPLPDIIANTALAHALAKVAGEPAITCYGDAPCFLTYALSAPKTLAPITGFTATWYPMTLTDHTGHNQVTAQWSTDGATYYDLDELHSVGDYFFYYGGKMRQAGRVRLDRPANRLYLRFALSGSGARLYSTGETRLTLEADLANTGFAGLTLPTGPITSHSSGPAVALVPTRKAPPLDRTLRERH
ncbi:glycosyltransferase family 39 protein [Desulfovibrio sp. TomC]|uniref:glycosyltransferase family 39 protein n=1 Tax=Desulfovibrio sp. TomC TaxID=1562888 RepID=UPI000573E7E1|nr:glycosyltransferase family 39 protein [Desulfovibrio sp. TomC]KHK00666.1 putative inner membrane protein [Desulfovibrio sp. TomC]